MNATAFAPVPLDLTLRLLRYSRELLEYRLGDGGDRRGPDGSGERGGPAAPEGHPVLREPLGLFVTLRRGEELRGCIGSITTTDALLDSIRRRTVDAALRDRRFTPVVPDELPELTIEHSVLSEPEPITGPDLIVPGLHGVILVLGSSRAVFLPEVAIQQGWSVPELLSALSVKAKLARDAWRGSDAELQVFRTQHYQEVTR